MAFTPHSAENAEFTRQAHCAARSLVYPYLFRTSESNIKFEDVDQCSTQRAHILDGELGIDKIARVTGKDFFAPLSFTIQERFRRPEAARYRDIVITEWNYNSNLPSELYKLYAHMFVYGYFDPVSKSFLEVVAVDVATVLYKLITQDLACKRDCKNTRTNQGTISIKLDDLLSCGAVIFHQRKQEATKKKPLIKAPIQFQDDDPREIYDEEDLEEPQIRGGLFDVDYTVLNNYRSD